METKYEPNYICWYERDFWADRVVARMTSLQRHFYRALLQAAFYCSTRPYLPLDDEQLCDLADAESLEQWRANKDAVLRKFTPVEVVGVPLLSHKRLLADWEQHLSAQAQRSGAGKASAEARKRSRNGSSTGVEQVSDRRSTNETETETRNQTEIRNQTESETETETGRATATSVTSVGSKTFDTGVSGAVSEPEYGDAEWLADTWVEIRGEGVPNPKPFRELLAQHYPGRVEDVLRWALTKSNYWEKTGKDVTQGNFASSYATLNRQLENYISSIKQRQADKSVRYSGGEHSTPVDSTAYEEVDDDNFD